MYHPMIPCPSCRRHVRAAASCPFCAAALPVDARAVPSAGTRLGRGALFAFAVSAAACGGSTESDVPTVTDTGASKSDTGTAPTDTGTVTDTGGPVAAYGAPADTGTTDTGSTTDTGVKDDGGPAPAYGLPPMDGG
jgi:hypothetical protein